MKQSQLEPLRLNICIKTVWLAVRFNCKLSFVLKNDLSEVLAHTENSYPLIRGEANINDYISCQLPQELYIPTRKIKIFVYLVSANGIVPAGFAVIPSQNKQKGTSLNYMLALERCQDPKAQIKIALSVDTSNKISTFTNNEVVKNVENKRFNSPISNLQVYRETSRVSYSANKIQHSKLRQNTSNIYQNIRQIKIISPEKKIQKQPEPDFSRQQLIKQHQQYWVEIVRMQGQNESLKEEISNLRNQNQTLKNNFQIIKIENQELRLENEKIYALISEVNQGNQTISRLQNELYVSKQKYQTSSNEYYSLNQQLKRTQLQLKEALDQVRILISKVQSQRIQDETNKQIIQNITWEKSHISQQTQELLKNLLNANSQIKMLKDQNQKLKNQIQKFQLEINSLNLLTSDFQIKFQGSKNKINQLQHELSQKNKRAEGLTNKANIFQLQIDDLKERIANLSTELDRLHKELQEENFINQNLIKDKQQQTKMKQKIQKELKQTIIHLENNNETLAKKLKLNQHISETLKSQLYSLQQKNTGLEQQFELMGQLLKKQQQQKQSFITSIIELEQLREVLEQKQANFNLQSNKQNQLLRTLQRQLESTKSLKDLGQNSISILEANHRQNQFIKSKLEQDLSTVQQQNKQLKSRISELQAELDCSNSQMAELRQKQATNQYYDSYNKSITQITLSQIKVEKEKNQLTRKYEEVKLYAEEKQNELNKTKQFAKNNLQEILKLRRDKEKLQNKLKEILKQ